MPTHVEVARGNANLDRDSVVLAESIFTLQKTDLVDYLGTLDNNYLKKSKHGYSFKLRANIIEKVGDGDD